MLVPAALAGVLLAWAALAEDPNGRAAAQPGVTLSAAQLQINQRISQAAIRRAAAVEAHLAGEPPPAFAAPSGDPVALSVAQLRVNQRIAQAAVRRANALQARVQGRPAPDLEPRRMPARFTLSATQLLINQRISQAALRRVNALVTGLGVELPTTAPAPDLVVRVAGRAVDLDGFGSSDSSLRAAIDRFGAPTLRRVTSPQSCVVGWEGIGLRLIVANFGLGSACDPDAFNAQRAELRAPWRTGRGLEVGEGVAELRRLYPDARSLPGGNFELTSAFSPIGEPGDITILSAEVANGRVVGLEVFIGGAGD